MEGQGVNTCLVWERVRRERAAAEMICGLLLLVPASTSHLLRARPPTLVFPTNENMPASRRGTPGTRNFEMATLLADLTKAESEADADALLREASPMLLQPFEGIPEPGSVYDGMKTTAEKADAFRITVTERAAKTRTAGNEATATALERLRDHVLRLVADSEAADAVARLRGGGRRAQADRDWEQKVDSALDTAERGIARIRSAVRTKSLQGVTAGDAAFSGFVVGVVFGKVLVGDPLVLGLGLGATFAFAQNFPEKAPARLQDVALRGGLIVRRARARM